MTSARDEQLALARAVRDPSVNYGDQTSESRLRLGVYQQLVFNNIAQFVESAFPVLKSVLADEKWQQLLRDFIVGYRHTSPYFVDISKGFLEFLYNNDVVVNELPPFTRELAHYEWLEIDISIRHAKLPAHNKQTPDRFLLSPLTEVVTYCFPVHQISADSAVLDLPAGSHHYCLFRDDEDNVQFSVLTPASALLLGLLAEADSPLTERAISRRLQTMLEPPVAEHFRPFIASTLNEYCQQKIVLSC